MTCTDTYPKLAHNQLDAIKGTVYFKNKQYLSCGSQSDNKILSKKPNHTVFFTDITSRLLNSLLYSETSLLIPNDIISHAHERMRYKHSGCHPRLNCKIS